MSCRLVREKARASSPRPPGAEDAKAAGWVVAAVVMFGLAAEPESFLDFKSDSDTREKINSTTIQLFGNSQHGCQHRRRWMAPHRPAGVVIITRVCHRA